MTTTQPETDVDTILAATPAPKGVDYAWPPHPTVAALKAAGIRFVCRYLSTDTAKNLSAPERDTLLAAGLNIALVWETTAQRMLGGYDNGKADGLAADKQATALKMGGIPLYFACDFNSTQAQQTQINAYLDGVAGTIGRARTGIYGGYWPVSRALDAKKATFAWQTYAWSGGNWDPRAQLRQILNGAKLGGVSLDLDEAHAPDFGQWPRPKPPATGPFRHVVPAGNTQTWHQLAQSRGTKDTDLAAVTRAKLNPLHLATFEAFMALDDALRAQGSPDAAMPAGLVYWTLNP